MTSSLRTVPLDDTLAVARKVAAELGISRVTDTTWLDRIGIPVYASIRPTSDRNSLAVNAGKGRWPKEAQVGAYMEAIEFAWAESWRHCSKVVTMLPNEIHDQPEFPHSLLSLGPVLGRRIDPSRPIASIAAEELFTGEQAMVPAELVFNPYPDISGQVVYGTSTNGLASGNTVDEATVHGLCELIERDISSYYYIDRASLHVPLDADSGVPDDVAALVARIESAGLTITLRYVPNRYGLPYFQAHLLEPQDYAPIAISTGIGVHLDPAIAAVRAISEAAQSRLTFIHGGRDDIIDRYAKFEGLDGRAAELEAIAASRARVTDSTASIPFTAIPSAMPTESITVTRMLTILRDQLARNDIHRVYRHVLSPADYPLAVVRVIAPGLEHFKPDFHRVGLRLAEYAEATKQ